MASNTYPTLSTTGTFDSYGVPATYASGSITVGDVTVSNPQPSRCAKQGHEMGDEAEYSDGSIVGTCTVCGEQIRGRRMVGGLGTAKLRMVMMELLAGAGDVDELKEAVLNIEALLVLEETQLREARALLDTAKAMLVRPRREPAAA